MKGRRVRSRKTGRKGFQFRFTDPLTKHRMKMTFWYATEDEADRARLAFMSKREDLKRGLPDTAGWEMPFLEMIKRFLQEASISTDRRRKQLQQILERNELGAQCGADLAQSGRLTVAARALATKKGTHYARFSVQSAYKQLSRWAASVQLLPYDPLAAWKRLAWHGHERR